MSFQDSYQQPPMRPGLPALTTGVKWLLIANLLGFVINNLLTVGSYTTFLGLSANGMLEGYGLGALRVLSYQFFHSLSLGHIVWNMISLYIFGTMVEGRGGFGGAGMGPWGLVKLYLFSGALGGLLFVAVGAMFGEFSTPVIGASGSVYGIMMFAACVDPRRPINLILFTIELRWLVGFLIFVGLYYSYLGFVQGGGDDGVAHSAHLGGALGGFLFFKFLPWRGSIGAAAADSGPFGWWARRSARRAAEAKVHEQLTLDRILDKVHQEGMTSLSGAERRFLAKASKNARK